jgi:hypothetical protein
MGSEKPLRDLKRDVAEAIDRARRNGKEIRKIERKLQSNLRVLKALKQNQQNSS